MKHTPVILLGMAAIVAWPAAQAQQQPAPAQQPGLLWHQVSDFGVEGQGWNKSDLASPYDRLPAKAQDIVRGAVWSLSRHSAGLSFRFNTDATEFTIRYELGLPALAMPHMPATGVSGLDLYVKLKGRWQWVANGRPSGETTTAQLVSGLFAGEKEFLLYLPLYNGVSSVEIGIPKNLALKKADPYPAERAKPVVFYGTSITQGGCASRPGMVHTSILGRKFDRPMINLGFSGSGTLDLPIADLMAEIDAAVYVLDCIPNLSPAQVAERTEPFVAALRKAKPTTPIVLVEDRTYTNAPAIPGVAKRNAEGRAANKAAFEKLIAAGDKNLFYIPGDKLMGDDGEGTVDSSHPTDLGFLRQAEAFAEVLGPILKK